MRFQSFAFASLLCALAQPLPAETPTLTAIKDARIITVSGAVIEKGTVLLQDGWIKDVGPNIQVPSGAWVVEGIGLSVYPGLIDALSTWGIPEAAPAPAPAGRAGQQTPQGTPPQQPQPLRAQGPDDRPMTASWLRAADLVRTTDRRLDTARSAGFTNAVTFPRQGIIAGQGAVINLAGARPGQMVVDPMAGLYLTMSTGGFSSYPGSLMGTIAYVRQVWIDAEYYRIAREAYSKDPSTVRRPAYDRALEGVLEARRVLLPAMTSVELDRMARFAVELKNPAVLYGLHQGYRAAALVKKAGLPVILNLKWPEKARDADPEAEETLRALEDRDKAPTTPAALAAAGVKFAFTSDGLETPKDLIRAVKKSLDVGLRKEDAIRALTLSAAEIYGVSKLLGSLEKGKLANLVVVKGDLFDEKSQVQMVFIDGVKYDPAPEQPQRRGGPPGAQPGNPTPVSEEERQ